MRILVTGHDGYIGAVTTRALGAAGHDVFGLDSYLYENCDFGAPDDVQPAVARDVRDVQAADLDGFDAIVHLAALSNDPIGALDSSLTEEVNCNASVRLAAIAKEAGVARFVFASSCSMYGASDGRPLTEDAPLQPLTAYARSKVLAEHGLLALADSAFTPVLMRNATAYGVSPKLRVDLVLNNLVGWAVTTGVIRIMSDGTPWRPLAHVRDIAATTLAILEAPRELVHAEAFNVGRRADNHRVRDLATIVERVVDGCEVLYAGSGDPDNRSYRVDFGKLERAFPELSLSWTAEAGARELADAYRADEMDFEAFESSRYIRLKRLQESIGAGTLDRDLRRAVPV